MPHANDCPCLRAVSDAADERARAIAREVQAMWDAKLHGASFRAIAAASGSSHEHVRQVWKIRPLETYPVATAANATKPVRIEKIASDDLDALLKLAEVGEKVDPTIPDFVVHGSLVAVNLGCRCERCAAARKALENGEVLTSGQPPVGGLALD